MSIKNFSDLIKMQNAEKKEFSAAQFYAWQQVKKAEQDILKMHRTTFDHASPEIQAQIDQEYESFKQEWGSQGSLAKELDERHKTQRVEFIKNKNLNRGNDLDKDRERDF